MTKLIVERIPLTDEIFNAVKNNEGYCVCTIEKTKDTKCMCKEFREQLCEGPCHCGLYRKKFI